MKWTNEDTNSKGLLEGGKTYDATVVGATEATSKASGNAMVVVKLAVHASPDKSVTQTVYILPAYFPKFKAFLESTGLFRQLAAQELRASDCEGKHCRVIMKDRKEDGSDYYEIDTFEIPADADAKLAAAKEELAAAPKVDLDDMPF
tara:strand:- start:6402 stop:6842 length:441 start_codon:yes stop_codon:yes gene_type:complete